MTKTKEYASLPSAKRGLAMATRAGRNVKIVRTGLGSWVLVHVADSNDD